MIKYVTIKETVKKSELIKCHDDAIKSVLNKYDCIWSDNHGITSQTTEDGVGIKIEILLPEDKVKAFNDKQNKKEFLKGNTAEEKAETIMKYINSKMIESDVLELEIHKHVNNNLYNKFFDLLCNKIKTNNFLCTVIQNGNLLIYKDDRECRKYVNNNFIELKKTVTNNKQTLITQFKQIQQKALNLYYNYINNKYFTNAEYKLIQKLYNKLNIRIDRPIVKIIDNVVYGVINDNSKIEYLNNSITTYYVREIDPEFNQNQKIDIIELNDIISKLKEYFN